MTRETLLALAAIAVVLVAILAFRRRPVRRVGDAPPPARLKVDVDGLPPDAASEIAAALAAGRKIDAIKHYRAAMRCDLKTAKEAVEAITDGRAPE